MDPAVGDDPTPDPQSPTDEGSTADRPSAKLPSGETSGEEVAPSLGDVVRELEHREYPYEALTSTALRVTVPSGDVVMGVVPTLEAATGPVAVLAESRDGVSALVMRDGEDLFVVKRSPALWEHFRSRGGPSAIFGSWRTGERTRFRMRHGALWKSIPEAVQLAESLEVHHLLPEETPPPPPPAPAKPATRTRATTPRATTRPSAAKATERPAGRRTTAPEEPSPRVCMRCFVQLPASGRCDCGG